jgi:hypothetical protein
VVAARRSLWADVSAWLRGDRAARFLQTAAAPFPPDHFSDHARSPTVAAADSEAELPRAVFHVGDRVAWKGADAEAVFVLQGQAPRAFTFAACRLDRSPAPGASSASSAPPCGSEPLIQADGTTQRMEAELNDFSAWM